MPASRGGKVPARAASKVSGAQHPATRTARPSLGGRPCERGSVIRSDRRAGWCVWPNGQAISDDLIHKVGVTAALALSELDDVELKHIRDAVLRARPLGAGRS